ncbi:MAG: Fe-S cluster assembly protein SufD [Candidatus Mycalebacterium zealandia]|nr:MAG: Fe-S cluster assembly protein SufD [Candidatus Mycalebacterium zealandia]
MSAKKNKNGALASLCEDARKTGIAVLDSVKADAAKAVAGIEFPTVRHEDWRFTNLAPVAAMSYSAANGKAKVTGKNIAAQAVEGLGAPALVFINGVYAPALSKPPKTKKTTVLPLSKAAKSHAEMVSANLGEMSDIKNEFFTALNTALFEDGAFIHIPEGAEIKKPVYIIYASTGGERVSSPRNLIVAEKNCGVKIVEHYISTAEENCLSNPLTEISVGEGARVEHYRLEFESRNGVNISTLNLVQEKDANTLSHSVLTGGAIVRNNIHPKLAGTGGDCLINGLFMPTGRQHMDNFMKVEHAAPHCDSRQIYNGVLNEKGRGVFHGRIIVHEGAIKTDAKQTNRNLLLSDTAQIDTKPQLEIYNDDVKCTHGATIGQMDEEAVFYLRSRGIPEAEARAVILRGFTRESISLMTVEPVREFLEKESERWFAAALGN